MISMMAMMLDILNHACVADELDDGYREYRIEVHCVAYIIEAKPTTRDYVGEPTNYNIRAYRREPN